MNRIRSFICANKPMNKTTINDAIKILQDLKEEVGGNAVFIVFGIHGDREYPKGWNSLIRIKDNEEFEEFYLT